jgi:anti-sigma B factor antagonist
LNLHIEQRENDGIVILDLKGHLTIGNADAALRDKLVALHQAGKVNIVLNLKDISEIDSTGLGTLVFGLARLRQAGGNLALASVDKKHLQLFVLTKLALAFEFFENEHDAEDSFFPDRAVKKFDILNFVQTELDGPATPITGTEATC